MIIDARNEVTNPAGNRPQDPGNVIGVAIHHSVSGDRISPNSSPTEELAHIRAIDAYHVDQNFGGFGYHTAVFASGRAYRCGDGQRAHVAKRNHQLRGIVAIGTFTDRLPSPAQMAGILEAIRWHRADLGRDVEVAGHGAWALPGQGTGCPGELNHVNWEQLLAGQPPASQEDHALSIEEQEELADRRAYSYLQRALLDQYRTVPIDENEHTLTIELRNPDRTPMPDSPRIVVRK